MSPLQTPEIRIGNYLKNQHQRIGTVVQFTPKSMIFKHDKGTTYWSTRANNEEIPFWAIKITDWWIENFGFSSPLIKRN